MSKKEKRKKERGPLTPKQKLESIPSIARDDIDAPTQFFGFNTPSKGGSCRVLRDRTRAVHGN